MCAEKVSGDRKLVEYIALGILHQEEDAERQRLGVLGRTVGGMGGGETSGESGDSRVWWWDTG